MIVGSVTKHGEWLAWRCRCLICGNGFIAKRSDAKTCSNACRMKLSRKRALYEQQKTSEVLQQLELKFNGADLGINHVVVEMMTKDT